MDFKGDALARQFQRTRRSLGLALDTPYFNAGLMAIDRAEWRRRALAERVARALRDTPERFPFNEQDALNATLLGDFAPLSPRYNFMGDFFLLDLERRIEPIVLHFVNAPKPWELELWRGEARFARELPRLVRKFALAGAGPGAVGAAVAAEPAAAHSRASRLRQAPVGVHRPDAVHRRDSWPCGRDLKVQFWLIAMACGCFQVLQAMTNGAAARSGIGAIWVGAMSATVSALTLVLVAVAIYRLPLPAANLLEAHGLKAVAGGMMGAFILAGLTFVAPRLGPTQTFILYFFVIAAMSVLIDGLGLLGTEAKPLAARQLVGVLLAGSRPPARSLVNGKPQTGPHPGGSMARACGKTSPVASRC